MKFFALFFAFAFAQNDTFSDPFGRSEDPFGRSGDPVVINPVADFKVVVDAVGIQFMFTTDVGHDSYSLEIQTLTGNYQNVTDWVDTGMVQSFDGENTVLSWTPPEDHAFFRFVLTPYDAEGNAGPSKTDHVQSWTDGVYHSPGTPYWGGSGYGAAVLLPTDLTDFSHYVTGVIAIKLGFPVGCPGITISTDLNENFVYTDDADPNPHRIIIIPSYHWSYTFNHRSFHYYVSNAAYTGCDLTDPLTSVDVINVNNQALLPVLNEDADMSIINMWSVGEVYEHHQINLTTIVNTQIAQSSPTVHVAVENGCAVTLNTEPGKPIGWGFVVDSTYDAPNNADLTDFDFQAATWSPLVGVSIRYDASVAGCETIAMTAKQSYIKISGGYTKVPSQNG